LFREFNKTSYPSAQGVTTVFATVFPLRIEIGRTEDGKVVFDDKLHIFLILIPLVSHYHDNYKN